MLASLITGHFLAVIFYGMLTLGCGYIGLNLLVAHGYSLGMFNKFMIEASKKGVQPAISAVGSKLLGVGDKAIECRKGLEFLVAQDVARGSSVAF